MSFALYVTGRRAALHPLGVGGPGAVPPLGTRQLLVDVARAWIALDFYESCANAALSSSWRQFRSHRAGSSRVLMTTMTLLARAAVQARLGAARRPRVHISPHHRHGLASVSLER
jgi:hypothetical protein